jgi:hypothetical protein
MNAFPIRIFFLLPSVLHSYERLFVSFASQMVALIFYSLSFGVDRGRNSGAVPMPKTHTGKCQIHRREGKEATNLDWEKGRGKRKTEKPTETAKKKKAHFCRRCCCRMEGEWTIYGALLGRGL